MNTPNNKTWAELHSRYKDTDWINKPNIFAETAVTYFPNEAKILDLGAGQGQDSRFFADQGFFVKSTDLEQSALKLNEDKLSDAQRKLVTTQVVDLREDLPFANESFDVVYAHLSLHYFDRNTTMQIFDEIARVLKPGGIFAFLMNSVSDPEFGTGKEIEEGYFQIDKTSKRYFSVKSTREFAQYQFVTILLDDHGETYKDSAKGIHNLIRFIGTKKADTKDYKSAIPYVGAIVERQTKEGTEVLMQTRWKPQRDPVYSGTLEFPAGELDHPFENIFKTLARELREECGLKLKSVKGESDSKIYSTSRQDEIMGFRPLCCTQQLKNAKPWIGFIFICQVESGEPKSQPSETKDVRWMKASEVHAIFNHHPQQLFGLELPAWEYYFKEGQ